MLTQNPPDQARKMPEGRKKLRWLVILSTMPLLGVVTAFGLVPQSELGMEPAGISIEEVILPKIAPLAATNSRFWRSERVQRGDTVAELLARLDIDDAAASVWLRTTPEAESFRKLSAGREVQAEIGVGGKLVALRYQGDADTQVTIENLGDSYAASTMPAQLEKRLFVRTGEIQSSLYAATDAIEMPDTTARQLAEIFGGDIDFHHDLRKGDKFTVVHEMLYSNGMLVNTGHIQAAEFINKGHTYRAIHFRGDYYTPEGKNVRKAFLRSPIEFSRVSSGFTNSRFHPVLNQWRAHRGVDFAAPIGTRVRATADGVIKSFGRQNGYGKFVTISHQGRITTLYGHLSRFAQGLRRGQRVAQGDVIAYVGMTGMTTGPHLHYEFRVDGQQRDPLRIALPDAHPVSAENMTEFQLTADSLGAQLDLLRNTNLAQLD